jgi:ribosomal protein S18 acetylase RimI-like enzyme
MEVLVRTATGRHDILAVAQLYIAAIIEALGSCSHPIEEVADRWESLADISISIAYTGQDRITGFIAVRDLGDETVEITDMFVSPEFRNRGIGQALLATYLERSSARLSVWSENHAAIALYKKTGFTVAGNSTIDKHGRSMIPMNYGPPPN